ncbi:TIGR02206 family membrane protein [Cetobacterium somerae]|uniref:YwaF family protein n=1 Tax=Cetobacterium sp. NK01 TaxID=2993530 RepID=UPI0021161D92|nr:TIGR02206 family membrane protein [Cetobacterium sp. NK01]MCQ8211642.1 TIGR02206 family membrane protein [Cetobacterium sp. NK01]
MEFELFDKLHLFYLLGYSLLFLFLYIGVAYNPQPKKVMRIISFVILLIKCGELFIRYKLIGEAWYQLLPLHLCNITLIFAVFGSIFRFTPFLYATFFWSIGAVFALLTPEVRETFPHFFNISFFSTHFYIIFVAITEYKIFNLRPSLESWTGSFLGLNIIAAGVYFINSVLGTNYLYINRKPTFSSPLNYFGDWPYYIIVVEFAYITLTLFLLFLFKKKDYKIKVSR